MSNHISTVTVLIVSLLVPLISLPITSDTHEYNKMVLLIFAALLLFTTYCIKSIQEGQLRIIGNRFFVLLLIITIFSILSLLFQSQSIMTSLTTPLATSTFVAGLVFVFFATQLIDLSSTFPITALVISGSIISVYSLLMYLSVIPKGVTTPAGNLVASGIFLFIIAIYCGTKLIMILSHQYKYTRYSVVFYSVSFGLAALSNTLLIYHLFTDQRPILLPARYGIEIFLTLMKNPATFLLGIGPAHFLTAFTLGKPAAINYTPLWNVVFTSSSSFLLTIASELGIFAGGVLLFFTWQVVISTIKELKNKGIRTAEWIALTGLSVMLIILPSSMVVWVSMLLLFIATASPTKPHTLSLVCLGRLRFILVIIPLCAVGLSSYLTIRGYSAEVSFKRGLDSLTIGDGAPAYNHLRAAIGLNPYHDQYRVVFAQINLSIADSFATQKDTSEEDKHKVPRLVQQAIDEARTAVFLNRTNALNWENLAAIYTNLINFANGADSWAIESYKQKITLDPKNPGTRISYGGLLLYLGRFQEAETVFLEAVNLKPDFANAWYNVGTSQARLGKYNQTRVSLEKALSLLPKDSNERDKIQKDIANLGKEATPTNDTILTPAAPPAGIPTISLGEPESEASPTSPAVE